MEQLIRLKRENQLTSIRKHQRRLIISYNNRLLPSLTQIIRDLNSALQNGISASETLTQASELMAKQGKPDQTVSELVLKLGLRGWPQQIQQISRFVGNLSYYWCDSSFQHQQVLSVLFVFQRFWDNHRVRRHFLWTVCNLLNYHRNPLIFDLFSGQFLARLLETFEEQSFCVKEFQLMNWLAGSVVKQQTPVSLLKASFVYSIGTFIKMQDKPSDILRALVKFTCISDFRQCLNALIPDLLRASLTCGYSASILANMACYQHSLTLKKLFKVCLKHELQGGLQPLKLKSYLVKVFGLLQDGSVRFDHKNRLLIFIHYLLINSNNCGFPNDALEVQAVLKEVGCINLLDMKGREKEISMNLSKLIRQVATCLDGVPQWLSDKFEQLTDYFEVQ